MKIKSFKVEGLHGGHNTIHLKFQDDLNILSGRNGSGKTTILKLIWYFISGNLDKAIAEINFSSATIETDEYNLTVTLDYNNKDEPFSLELTMNGLNFLKNFKDNKEITEIIKSSNDSRSWFLTQYIGQSLFMPTFRMIEGGFTTEKYDIKHDVIKQYYLNTNNDNNYDSIEKSLNRLSENLSKVKHQFITNISAKDIDIFLVKKYAEIMKKANNIQIERLNLYTKNITLDIDLNSNTLNKEYNEKPNDSEIKSLIKDLEEEYLKVMHPLEQIKESILNFIPYYDMEFDSRIYFLLDKDKLEPAIKKDQTITKTLIDYMERKKENLRNNGLTINNLSAGEKQLITFIAYNTFCDNTIFFIDEPELSLHIDWQSKLFSLLKEQNKTNQFIISTHSPFIYSIFPDKEIIINEDKGYSESK